MAVIHDVMPAFELFQPVDGGRHPEHCSERYGERGLGAGRRDGQPGASSSDRIKRPEVVVDLSRIPELSGVRFGWLTASRSAP